MHIDNSGKIPQLHSIEEKKTHILNGWLSFETAF